MTLYALRKSVLSGTAVVALSAVAFSGCTDTQRASQSSSYLIVDQFVAAQGSEPDDDSGFLDSDVSTKGSVFGDIGKVTLRLALRDPGSTTAPTQPTSNNFITVNRYHVRYVRSDGKNTQGVDVPFEFDGSNTATVRDTGAVIVLNLVRAQAKLEAPLKALAGLGGSVLISTIAEVTLFGVDQTGRDVMVKAFITVNFADFADPA